MQFTENEWCYLLWHCGWRPPSIWVRCGLDRLESQFNSSAYLERKKNSAPGADGCVGYDVGGSMWNERLNSFAAGLPDAFVLFDWRENMLAAKRWADDHPTNPFGPWGTSPYPNSTRNDTTLDVAGIAQRVGPNPYAIERSPYWEMLANGVPVHDLPVPPRDIWVSPLAGVAPLTQGQSGTPTSPLGIRINALSHRLLFEDCWVTKTGTPAGTPTWFYGSDWVKSSLIKHQTRMASMGLWDGPIDGTKFTVEYSDAWDAVLHYNHLIGRN